MDRRLKESINLYKDVAMVQKPPSEHCIEYEILDDTTDTEGRRTIIIKPRDMAIYRQKVEEIIGLLTKQMEEQDNKIVQGLLRDVLGDYWEENLDKVLKKLKTGEPVKVKEGCFKLIIGDGRRKNHEEIILRE